MTGDVTNNCQGLVQFEPLTRGHWGVSQCYLLCQIIS